jgi:hypothetical protein
MKKEFLQDYEAKEDEYFRKYNEKVISQGLDSIDRFPELSRFNRPLIEPIVIADRTTFQFDKQKIWSQIPFAGTLVIPLHNHRKENLLEFNGFEESDIPKLIDLAKETGKVQFVLATRPTLFEDLDHLDPIFEEFRPPLFKTLPLDLYVDDPKQFTKWQAHFHDLSKPAFQKYMHKKLENIEGRDFFVASMENRMGAYIKLKILGMNWLSDEIENWMIDEPRMADIALLATTYATGPLFGGLGDMTNHCFSKVKIFGLDAFPSTQEAQIPQYPIEIGRFLMEKLTVNPTNYYGCLDVIDHYKHNELYKVLRALDAGIKDGPPEAVVKDISELNTVMENVWQSAYRIKRSGRVIGGGFRIILGLVGLGVGTTIFPPAAGIGFGLLAQLGLNVADKYVDGKNVGERVAKLLNKKYITTIYDFTRKHSIPESASA